MTDGVHGPTRAATVLHHLIAALLVFAAVAKTYAMSQSHWETSQWSRWVDLGVIQVELLIALLLLLNLRLKLAWALALIAFTVFTGVSVRNVLAGATACGCFGPAAVDPKLMTVIDLGIVVALLITGPRLRRTTPASRPQRALGTAVLSLMLLGVAATVYSAVPKRGLVAAENGIHDFGLLAPAAAGDCRHGFVIHNTAGHAMRIVRTTSSCGCTVAQLPADPIPPGGSAVVDVRADWSKADGHTVSRIVLYTDSRWTPEVVLIVSGEVETPDRPATAPSP